jgi:Flp pilus assembly protein TadG
MRPLSAFKKNVSGVAAVEFAIVGTLFIILVLGIIAYGMYFSVTHSVQQVAAEAARAAIGGLTDLERNLLAVQRADEVVGAYPLLDGDFMTVQAAAVVDEPNLFEVTITYDATHLGLAAFAGLFPAPPDQIERSSIVRRGGW